MEVNGNGNASNRAAQENNLGSMKTIIYDKAHLHIFRAMPNNGRIEWSASNSAYTKLADGFNDLNIQNLTEVYDLNSENTNKLNNIIEEIEANYTQHTDIIV